MTGKTVSLIKRNTQTASSPKNKECQTSGSDHSSSEDPAAEKQTLDEPLNSQTIKLLTYDLLPEWLKDNQFILAGHRPHSTVTECLYSLCYFHNGMTILLLATFAAF